MFEYHVKGEPRVYDENSEWECTVEAVYTFCNPIDERETAINCLFSRVYLDDMDLINMGAEASETADYDGIAVGGSSSTPSLPLVPVSNKEEHNNKSADVTTADGEEEGEAKTPIKEHDALTRRKIRLRKKLESMKFALNAGDDDSSMLEQSFGPLVGVSFECYKSAHNSRKKRKVIRYNKQSVPGGVDKEDDEWTTAPEAFSSASSTEDDAGLKKKVKPLAEVRDDLQQLLNFDFGFCPERDAALVAKNADKHFAKDAAMRKYWFQRHRLFSKLKDGILMDREGWFSVTPERVARHVADRMVLVPDCTILDAFTGVGGNAIQFALRGAYVIAVDVDPLKLRCARQNARVYGVANRICFICGSFFHVAASMFGARRAKEGKQSPKNGETAVTPTGYPHGVDAVFLSPPWGGPAYFEKGRPFDLLSDMEPNGVEIFETALEISPNIVYFLPKNTRTEQLMALAGGTGGNVEMEQTVMNEKLKALHAYYGIFVGT
uniref:Trimethylguanosine synthase n=1 Tax=Globodera pallida TaxID=36090 RepID=A0A183BLJ0_GLOPA